MNILCISGSLRKQSANTDLLRALTLLTPPEDTARIFADVGRLPLFNPDDDQDVVAEAVADFRCSLQEASVVVFCTPEYAHGIPGALKNALDWIVSSGELYGKPVGVISASGRALHVGPALAEVLVTMGARMAPPITVSLDGANLTPEEIASHPLHREQMIGFLAGLRADDVSRKALHPRH
jgi:NAD(P)H-dependent FMN reductase